MLLIYKHNNGKKYIQIQIQYFQNLQVQKIIEDSQDLEKLIIQPRKNLQYVHNRQRKQ